MNGLIDDLQTVLCNKCDIRLRYASRRKDHVYGRSDHLAQLALRNPMLKASIEPEHDFLMLKLGCRGLDQFSIPEFAWLVGFREFSHEFIVSVAAFFLRDH